MNGESKDAANIGMRLSDGCKRDSPTPIGRHVSLQQPRHSRLDWRLRSTGWIRSLTSWMRRYGEQMLVFLHISSWLPILEPLYFGIGQRTSNQKRLGASSCGVVLLVSGEYDRLLKFNCGTVRPRSGIVFEPEFMGSGSFRLR